MNCKMFFMLFFACVVSTHGFCQVKVSVGNEQAVFPCKPADFGARSSPAGNMPNKPDAFLPFTFAQPITACSELKPLPKGNNNFVALAMRGQCTFFSKARAVQQAGGGALLVANNVQGAPLMPLTGRGEDDGSIFIPVVSILIEHAQQLEGIIQSSGGATASVHFGELWRHQEQEEIARQQIKDIEQGHSIGTPAHTAHHNLGQALVHQGGLAILSALSKLLRWLIILLHSR
jgi:hypothetical protein